MPPGTLPMRMSTVVILVVSMSFAADAQEDAGTGPVPSPPVLPTVAEVLERVAAPWKGVDAIAFNVTRTLHLRREGAQTQSWRYVYSDPDKFLIRTFSPAPTRQLYGNHREIWEYVPSEKKALVTTIDHVTEKRRRELFEMTTQPYNIPFFLIHEDLPRVPDLAVEPSPDIDGRPAVLVTGRPGAPGLKQIRVAIDRERWVPLEVTMVDDDSGVVRARHRDHRPVGRGAYLAHRLEFDGTSLGVISRVDIVLGAVDLNPQLSPRAFDFTAPDGVGVIRHRAHATAETQRAARTP